MTVWVILYANPVPTVKLFAPVPINKDVADVVKYLSPSCPAVPELPEDADVPLLPDDADVPDVPVEPDVPAVAS